MTKKQKKMLVRILITAVMLIALKFIPITGIPQLLAYVAAYLVIGYDILRKAGKGILNGRAFDENFLMTLATLGAFFLAIWTKSGDYVEGIAVMLFYQIGELFQSYAVGKSRRNITALMDIRPDYANIERDGKLEQVDPDDVAVGTVITVQPGEKVPLDGVVVEGTSSLNTSALTGESLPRDVKAGDEIISGCIDLSGVLKIRTTKAFGESTVSKILDLVENASSRKSRSETFISRFAKVYTPAVCAAALALAVLVPLGRMLAGADANWTDWVYRALSFLVVSCPCALVISIPLSFFAGIGGASREGVLIKGSNYLEALSAAKVVVFDKTGTLTEGKPRLLAAESFDPLFDEERILGYAASLEGVSEHPLALAVTSAAEERNLHLYPVSDFASVSGLGVSGNVDLENESIPLLLGNKRLMEERQVSFDAVKDLDARLAELSDSGATPLLLAVNGRLVGMLAVADTIRPETAGVVKELRQLGLRVIMLSGDNRRTAEAIAKSAGIDEVIADVLPDGKEKVISELQAAGLRVGMIGDGINDAPALARADVGMAMGNGIDVAVEAGDIVLLGSDTRSGKGLRGVVTALELSRAALRNIRENLGWAFGYNILCLPIAAGVLKIFGGPSLSPMIAGAAMAFSSVSVVLNALRLRRFGK